MPIVNISSFSYKMCSTFFLQQMALFMRMLKEVLQFNRKKYFLDTNKNIWSQAIAQQWQLTELWDEEMARPTSKVASHLLI